MFPVPKHKAHNMVIKKNFLTKTYNDFNEHLFMTDRPEKSKNVKNCTTFGSQNPKMAFYP